MLKWPISALHLAGSAQYCRISKNQKKMFYCFPLILRIKSFLQMYFNPTVCFKIKIIKFKFCCNSVVSQPLPNLKTQFSQKEDVDSYDNIALKQRYCGSALYDRVSLTALSQDFGITLSFCTGCSLSSS